MSPSSRRAWIEIQHFVVFVDVLRSPSSRRAWIEIESGTKERKQYVVALLTEGVDRNLCCLTFDSNSVQSPSSRRAWIEIAPPAEHLLLGCVALLTEGVDRNFPERTLISLGKSRPPHGGRG